MNDKHEEWLKQADYDMDTADAMFHSGRYFYAVFMCHLSIEKSLKSLYAKVLNDTRPKLTTSCTFWTKSARNLNKRWKSW